MLSFSRLMLTDCGDAVMCWEGIMAELVVAHKRLNTSWLHLLSFSRRFLNASKGNKQLNIFSCFLCLSCLSMFEHPNWAYHSQIFWPFPYSRLYKRLKFQVWICCIAFMFPALQNKVSWLAEFVNVWSTRIVVLLRKCKLWKWRESSIKVTCKRHGSVYSITF